MAVRVADSLKQQNDLKTFPVAYSEDIWLDENKGEGDANFKDLQTLYNENKLGGSGLPKPESADKVLLSASSNTRADGLEWKQVSKNDVGLQLPEFESLEEWDSLPVDEKSKYYNAGKGYVVIKEDVKGAKGVIDDTRLSSTVTTLSAKKISDSLVDKADKRALENYDTKGNQSITLKTDANLCIPEEYTESINYVFYGNANLPTKNSSYFIRTQRSSSYIVQFASDVQNELTETEPDYIRKAKLIDGTWIFSPWQEIVIKDTLNNKHYNISLLANEPNRYRILTWNSTDKGGATVKIDFTSRFGNIGLGSGSMIVTFNTTITPTIWLQGKNNETLAYFEISYAKDINTTCYLDLVTLKKGSDFQLRGAMDVSILEIYGSTVTFNNLEEQTNEFTPIDNTSNYIIKKNELNATMDNAVSINDSTFKYLYQNTTKEYLTSSGKNLTASKTGLLQVMILKEKAGNTIDVAINGVLKTSYANYFGENITITLVTPVKQGDKIQISDDIKNVGEQHYIVLQVGIS